MSMKKVSFKMGDWTFNYNSLRDFEFDISEPHNSYDYIIFGEDTDRDGIADAIYAKNGNSGKIEAKSNEFREIVDYVISRVSEFGRVVRIRIVGSFEVDNSSEPVNIPSNIYIELDGTLIAKDYTKTMVKASNVSNIWLVGVHGMAIIVVVLVGMFLLE